MAKITYVEFDGKEHVLDVAPGSLSCKERSITTYGE